MKLKGLIVALVLVMVLLESMPSMAEEVTYIKPEMVLIGGGTFEMGSEVGEDYEKPVHTVVISTFYMGKYEVTNKEYKKFDSDHGWKSYVDDNPVESVTWDNAVKYCNWLSDKEGLDKCYSENSRTRNIILDITKNGYRLPTEAEWEYACRAGTTTHYYWGDEMNGDYCWNYYNSGDTVHPVGQKSNIV